MYKFALFLLVILLAMPAAFAVDVDNDALGKAEGAKAMKLYNAKNYKEAQKLFAQAAQHSSRDAGIQYYLAASALQNGDFETAKRACARVIVARHYKQGFGAHAKLLLVQRFPTCEPYPCVTGAGMLSRFTRKHMPIKIYVTQGLMLPVPFRGRESLAQPQVVELLKTLKAQGPAFYQHLERDPAYNSAYASAVVAGLQKWDWARSEKILDYQLVNSPYTADVVVLWCPKLDGKHSAYTQTMTSNFAGNKIFIQMATGSATELNSNELAWVAAHEFGHAWGISYHSLNPKDLMAENAHSDQPHSQMTENDKLTLRALYDIAPTLVR